KGIHDRRGRGERVALDGVAGCAFPRTIRAGAQSPLVDRIGLDVEYAERSGERRRGGRRCIYSGPRLQVGVEDVFRVAFGPQSSPNLVRREAAIPETVAELRGE